MEKTYLDALLAIKRDLVGMYSGTYPPTPEVIAYNQVISEVMKKVMARIHAELDSRVVKQA